MKEAFFYVDIPQERKEDIDTISKEYKDLFKILPLIDNTQPLSHDINELFTRQTWLTSLAVTGQSGFPESTTSGNVFRESTSLRLSFRIPPTLDEKVTLEKIKKLLTENPPFNAKIELNVETIGPGWNMEIFSDHLKEVINKSSLLFFNKDFIKYPNGSTVPFVKSISKMFPKSEIICTGAMGSDSNMHGPNESIDLGYFKKFICCMSYIFNSY